MMDPMRNGMMEMMITFLLPAMSEMIPPIKQPRMAVKAQHEAEIMLVFNWKHASFQSTFLQNHEVSSKVNIVSGSFCRLATRILL